MNLKMLEDILNKNGVQFDVYEDGVFFEGKEVKDGQLYRFQWVGGEADMSIEVDAENLEELAEIIFDEYESFDVDYETSLWIGNDGHGKNGAPYSIKDIWEDFKKYEDDLWELFIALKNANL